MPTIYSDNNETPIIYTDYNNKVIENKKIEEIIKKEINFKKLKKPNQANNIFRIICRSIIEFLKRTKLIFLILWFYTYMKMNFIRQNIGDMIPDLIYCYMGFFL